MASKIVDPPEENQKELIAKLRENIIQAQEANPNDIAKFEVDRLDDYAYKRFLRARKWDLTAATKMLVDMLKWRTVTKPHTITESQVYPEYKKGKVVMQGYDKEGRLLIFNRVRYHVIAESDATVCQQLVLYIIEKAFGLAKPEVPYTTIIFDLTGFGLSNMDYKLIKFIIDMLANYYPETLGLALVVNAPWFFSGCWKLIKPWIDPVTASKVVFIKSSELTNYVDKENLLEELGGDVKVDFSNYTLPDDATQTTTQ